MVADLSGPVAKTTKPRGLARRLVNVAIILASLAWLGWLVNAEHAQLGQAIGGLGHARGGLIVAAYACERTSFIALGRMQRRLLRAVDRKLTLRSILGIVIAGNALSVSVPIAGAGLGAAFSFHEYERHKIAHHAAVYALTVSGVLSTVTLMVIAAAGALISGNPVAAILGLLSAAAIVAAILGVLFALRIPTYQRLTERLAANVLRMAWRAQDSWPPRLYPRLSLRSRRRERLRTAEAVVAELRERLAALHLSRADWAAATSLALLNWLGDAACLTLAIRAAGLPIPFRELLLIWSAGQAANSIGFTPGGVGVVEVALVAALTAAHEPAAGATVAVLIYRMISLWLVLLVGWVIFIALRSRHPKAEHPPQPPPPPEHPLA
jgi:putative heme transporter